MKKSVHKQQFAASKSFFVFHGQKNSLFSAATWLFRQPKPLADSTSSLDILAWTNYAVFGKVMTDLNNPLGPIIWMLNERFSKKVTAHIFG